MTDRAPLHQPRPRLSEEDERAPNPALLVGSIVLAKVATLAVVLWLSWTPRAGLFVAVVSWYWLIVLAALVAAPLLLAIRLRRVRRRRNALLRAEWLLEPDAPRREPSTASR